METGTLGPPSGTPTAFTTRPGASAASDSARKGPLSSRGGSSGRRPLRGERQRPGRTRGWKNRRAWLWKTLIYRAGVTQFSSSNKKPVTFHPPPCSLLCEPRRGSWSRAHEAIAGPGTFLSCWPHPRYVPIVRPCNFSLLTVRKIALEINNLFPSKALPESVALPGSPLMISFSHPRKRKEFSTDSCLTRG